MTAYNKHTVLKHTQYGRTLTPYENSLLQTVAQKKDERQKLLQEIRRSRAERYKRLKEKVKLCTQGEK